MLFKQTPEFAEQAKEEFTRDPRSVLPEFSVRWTNTLVGPYYKINSSFIQI
jgi:hypothetical protein